MRPALNFGWHLGGPLAALRSVGVVVDSLLASRFSKSIAVAKGWNLWSRVGRKEDVHKLSD